MPTSSLGGEVMIVTLVVSLFTALFFAGYRWARWVAGIVLGLLAPIIASMTFEGFGYGFLVVAILYAVIIAMLFIHGGQTKSVQPADVKDDSLDIKKPVSPPSRPVADGFYVGEEMYRYPLLLKRYQSLFIDAILFFAVMVIIRGTTGCEMFDQGHNHQEDASCKCQEEHDMI